MAFILKEEWELQRKLKVVSDPPDFKCGVTFAPVQTERQTQDYGSHVKLHAEFGE